MFLLADYFYHIGQNDIYLFWTMSVLDTILKKFFFSYLCPAVVIVASVFFSSGIKSPLLNILSVILLITFFKPECAGRYLVKLAYSGKYIYFCFHGL